LGSLFKVGLAFSALFGSVRLNPVSGCKECLQSDVNSNCWWFCDLLGWRFRQFVCELFVPNSPRRGSFWCHIVLSVTDRYTLWKKSI